MKKYTITHVFGIIGVLSWSGTVLLREMLLSDIGVLNFILGISNSVSEAIDTEKIFDKFYRADASRKGEGAGLGLYICRKLVEEMNGTIVAQNAKGKLIITVEMLTYEN